MVDFNEWSAYPSSDITTELYCKDDYRKASEACQNICHRQQQSYSGLQWPERSHSTIQRMTWLQVSNHFLCFFSSTINFLLLWSSFQPPARRKPMGGTWSCNNSWIRIERSLYGTYHWERKGFGFPRRHWWQFKVHNLYGATQKCNNHSWRLRTLLLLLSMCKGLEVKGGPLPHLQGSYWSRD